MQNFWRSTLRLCRGPLGRRPSVFPASSGTPRRHPSALARRDSPLKPAASALPEKLLDQLSRFAYEPWNVQHNTGVGSKKKQIKLDKAIKVMDEAEISKEIPDVHANNLEVDDDVWPIKIFKGSTHRDGSIYKKNWKRSYGMDIADREETVSELSTLSTKLPCHPDQENCICHGPFEMIQILSLRLAKTPTNSGPIQLYGYMAARDDMDGRLNYVFNHTRDDPVIVQQGSLLEVTGPRRGIMMLADLLFEFDMRIKTGEKEEDDIQLIDGVIHNSEPMFPCPRTIRISGDYGGAVDMSYSLVESAVEAVIEVVVSEVQRDFDLSLSSIVSIRKKPKEVKLFHGKVGEMGVKRSAVAVPWRSTMYLKFKIVQEGRESDATEHYCSFGAKVHGCTNRQMQLDQGACISMKVTWSPPFS